METLFGSPLFEVFSLLLFIPEPGFSLKSLLFFSLKIKVLIGGFEIIDEISFGILKGIFHHASHSVKFLCLLGVKVFFVFILLSFLSFLFDLLIEPLFLFVLEKLSSCIILCIVKDNYLSPRLRINDIRRFRYFDLDDGIRGKRFLWSSSWV